MSEYDDLSAEPAPTPDPVPDPDALATPDPALSPDTALTPEPEHPEDPVGHEDLEHEVLTAEDEYPRPLEGSPGEPSIDDLLETDRVTEEGGDSRNTDGYRFDATRDRALEDVAAAEQGNRDEDRMVTEGDGIDEITELAGSDADAVGADRELPETEPEG